MSLLHNGLTKKLRERAQALPFARRLGRLADSVSRRVTRKQRTVTESPNLLPLLIQVLAAFSKSGSEVLEEEIDSSLGFLRYDYPGGGLRGPAQAVPPSAERAAGPHGAMAQKLAGGAEHRAQDDARRMQLYDLIWAKAGMEQQQVVEFLFGFMTQLGMASQAIDIVYQLNASGGGERTRIRRSTSAAQSPLESLTFGANAPRLMSRSKGLQDDGAAGRVPLPRSYPAEKPELAWHRRARAARCVPLEFCRIYYRSAHRPRRTGAHLPGSRVLLSTRRRTSR